MTTTSNDDNDDDDVIVEWDFLIEDGRTWTELHVQATVIDNFIFSDPTTHECFGIVEVTDANIGLRASLRAYRSVQRQLDAICEAVGTQLILSKPTLYHDPRGHRRMMAALTGRVYEEPPPRKCVIM